MFVQMGGLVIDLEGGLLVEEFDVEPGLGHQPSVLQVTTLGGIVVGPSVALQRYASTPVAPDGWMPGAWWLLQLGPTREAV